MSVENRTEKITKSRRFTKYTYKYFVNRHKYFANIETDNKMIEKTFHSCKFLSPSIINRCVLDCITQTGSYFNLTVYVFNAVPFLV